MDEQADILSDAERQALATVSAPSRPAYSVLVVDDHAGNREALSFYLGSRGWNCIEAASVKKALEALLMRPSIGLIITDLRMQPEDGLSLIRQVRASEWAQLPIIVVSGDTDVQEAVKAMHLGVLDVLLKPVDLDRLLELVSKELNP